MNIPTQPRPLSEIVKPSSLISSRTRSPTTTLSNIEPMKNEIAPETQIDGERKEIEPEVDPWQLDDDDLIQIYDGGGRE